MERRTQRAVRSLGAAVGLFIGFALAVGCLVSMGGCESWFTAPSPATGKAATAAELEREQRAATLADAKAIDEKAAAVEREKREADLRKKQRAAEVQRAAAKITGEAKAQVEDLFAALAIEDETRDAKLTMLSADLDALRQRLEREASARNEAYAAAGKAIADQHARVDAWIGGLTSIATGGQSAGGVGGVLGLLGLGSVGSVLYGLSQRSKAKTAQEEADANETIARQIVNAIDTLRQRSPQVAEAMKEHKDALQAALGHDARLLVESERVQ